MSPAITATPLGSGCLNVLPRLRRWTSCPAVASWAVRVELMLPVPPMNKIFTPRLYWKIDGAIRRTSPAIPEVRLARHAGVVDGPRDCRVGDLVALRMRRGPRHRPGRCGCAGTLGPRRPDGRGAAARG